MCSVKIDTAEGPLFVETIDGVLVHGREPLTDKGRSAMAKVIAAAREKMAPATIPCPKCGMPTDLIGRCFAKDCPSLEARLRLFREAAK